MVTKRNCYSILHPLWVFFSIHYVFNVLCIMGYDKSLFEFSSSKKFVSPNELMYNLPFNLFLLPLPPLVLNYYMNLTLLGVEFYAY